MLTVLFKYSYAKWSAAVVTTLLPSNYTVAMVTTYLE